MKLDNFISTEKKICAIIICEPADPLTGRRALKYQWVDNPDKIGPARFLKFARGFYTAQYVNFYSNKSGAYLGRIYLKNENMNTQKTDQKSEYRKELQRVRASTRYREERIMPELKVLDTDQENLFGNDFIHCQHCGEAPENCICKLPE